MDGKELLSADETAAKLNISRRTLLRWARERKIECVRISRKVVFFTGAAIDKFLQAGTIGVESPHVNHKGAGRKMTSPAERKGGGTRVSGESWQDLRTEVLSWES